MAYDEEVGWYPSLTDRQLEIFNSTARALLVAGPRLSSKTWGVLHKIVRHLWETPDARVAMFSRTLKNSKDGGTWTLLHRYILKEWIDAKIGLRYTTKTSEGKPGPKVDGQTRTPYFRIRNSSGGESELMLFSLDYDDDIEDKLKEMQFSMIYFSELDKFRSRKILSVSLPSLRMPHLSFDQQMWIADTNPSEEGESSWIYKVWYLERAQTYGEYCDYNKKKGLPTLGETEFINFQKGLELIEIRPAENPYLDPRQLEELKSTYAYDIGLFSRYVEGKWVYGDGDSSVHFRGFFNKHQHVIGSIESPDESQWEYANPTRNCFSLITGWDLGDTYHAVGILEKTYVNSQACFCIMDEVVSLKAQISNEMVTESVMEKIKVFEDMLNRKLDLESAWSDRSSIEKYSSSGDTFPYLQVYAASGERIFLKGTPKPAGSVRIRVQLVKMLLRAGRLKVSAHCTFAIQMFEKLKKGDVDFVVQDENKHIFDAISYALLMEMVDELENGPAVGKRELTSGICTHV